MAAPLDRSDEAPAFGVYVHWPFCRAKCPYCDFNSHVRPGIDPMRYADMLVRELSHFASRTPGREASSIFFGGGTPSLMPPEAVARVLEAIASLWPVAPDAEITLEANPTSAEAQNFRGYRAAGVNRLSIGLQALDDEALKALGREHTAAEGLAAYHLAGRVFPRISCDLIYARPGQTVAAWRGELSRALDEARGHLSLYQLTIEPGTPFAARHARGTLVVPDDEAALALYETTQELMEAAGLPAYEVSNHAAPGEESRHNLVYWRYGDYAGVGPGAHSRLADGPRRLAIQTVRAPEAWRRAVERAGHAIAEEIELSPPEQGEEFLLMGLRLGEGISLDRFQRLSGFTIPAATLRGLEDDGLVTYNKAAGRIIATRRGRQVLNAVIALLVAAAREPVPA